MIKSYETVFKDRTEWYIHGKLHRDDGPAIEWDNGAQYWFYHDVRHRENGPAVVWPMGDKLWFLFGESFTEEKFKQITYSD